MGKIYDHASCVNVWIGEVPANMPKLPRRSLYRLLMLAVRGPCGSLSWRCGEIPKAPEMAIKQGQPCWHTRGWVVEEFAFAKEVYFCFGGHRVLFHQQLLDDWHIGWITELYFMDFCSAVFAQMPRLRGSDKSPPGDSQETSLSLWQAASSLQWFFSSADTTNRKDKVYSVLGMTNEDTVKLVGVDYSLPLEAVYSRATYASIKASNRFDILENVRTHDDRKPAYDDIAMDLRSWSFNFHKRGRRAINKAFRPELGSIITRKQFKILRSVHLDESNRLLTIYGGRCDTVKESFCCMKVWVRVVRELCRLQRLRI